MAGKFVTYTGQDGKFYFRLKAGNGEIILTSQGYKAEKDRDNGIASVRKNSQTEARFQKKAAKNGEHYFVLTASNGQVIGTSQMYKSESGCSNGIASVARNAADAAVVAE